MIDLGYTYPLHVNEFTILQVKFYYDGSKRPPITASDHIPRARVFRNARAILRACPSIRRAAIKVLQLNRDVITDEIRELELMFTPAPRRKR